MGTSYGRRTTRTPTASGRIRAPDEGPVAGNAPQADPRQRGEAIRAGVKFETTRIAGAPDATAPDGSEVRVLCQGSRGGLALFTLPPRAVSKAVAHHSVE